MTFIRRTFVLSILSLACANFAHADYVRYSLKKQISPKQCLSVGKQKARKYGLFVYATKTPNYYIMNPNPEASGLTGEIYYEAGVCSIFVYSERGLYM